MPTCRVVVNSIFRPKMSPLLQCTNTFPIPSLCNTCPSFSNTFPINLSYTDAFPLPMPFEYQCFSNDHLTRRLLLRIADEWRVLVIRFVSFVLFSSWVLVIRVVSSVFVSLHLAPIAFHLKKKGWFFFLLYTGAFEEERFIWTRKVHFFLLSMC